MKPTKSQINLKPKVAYISIKKSYHLANYLSSTLPTISIDLYFMRQIKLLNIFPFKDNDFIIVSTDSENLKSTITQLYKQDVRLFMTSASTTNFIKIQDIIVECKFTDAIVFDTASSGFVPRIINPPNMFRYATLDTNAKDLLLSFFNKYIYKSAIISNNSVYANGIVDIFTNGGSTLINQIDNEYIASQFDNYDNIFVASDSIHDTNDILDKLSKIMHKYNKSKNLILSDIYSFHYDKTFYNIVNDKIEGSSMLCHSKVLSWNSAQSLIYSQFVKKLFNGKLISPLITDLMFVLDYVYRVYSLHTHKVVKKMYNILNNSGIIYINGSNTFNPGDHNIVSLTVYEARINNLEVEWIISNI